MHTNFSHTMYHKLDLYISTMKTDVYVFFPYLVVKLNIYVYIRVYGIRISYLESKYTIWKQYGSVQHRECIFASILSTAQWKFENQYSSCRHNMPTRVSSAVLIFLHFIFVTFIHNVGMTHMCGRDNWNYFKLFVLYNMICMCLKKRDNVSVMYSKN